MGRTFQEFLAAKALIDENDISLLVEHAHDDQWREVVMLTVGLAPRMVRENLVERLLKRATTRKRVRSRLYLLAAACTQIAYEEMKGDIRSRIEQGLSELLPLKSKEEVEAMATAGPLAIPYLAPRFEYSPQVAAACVQALLQIGGEAALNALQAYTTDDTPEVMATFILGLRSIPNKPVYAQRFLSHIKDISASPTMFELLPFLSHLTSLRVYAVPAVHDLSFLQPLSALTSLQLSSLPAVHDLSILQHLPALTNLELSSLPAVRDLSILQHLPALTSLELSSLPAVRDLSILQHLPALTSLELFQLPEVRDLSSLQHLPALTSLQLNNLPEVQDLSILQHLPALTNLRLFQLPEVHDLSSLQHLPALTSLQLNNLPAVRDLSILQQLKELRTISLGEMAQGCVFPQDVLKRVRIKRLS